MNKINMLLKSLIFIVLFSIVLPVFANFPSISTLFSLNFNWIKVPNSEK
jgi:hypothetical protein